LRQERVYSSIPKCTHTHHISLTNPPATRPCATDFTCSFVCSSTGPPHSGTHARTHCHTVSHSVCRSVCQTLTHTCTRAHIKPLSKSHDEKSENVRERQDPQQSCLLVDNDETVKVVVNQLVDHVAQRVTQQTRLISVSVRQHVRVCVCVSTKASSKHTRMSL